MDYKTGTYIMRTRKVWKCTMCGNDTIQGGKCFTRVKEYGKEKLNQYGEKYRHKTYTRYHIECAKKLKDLTKHEKSLLNNIKNENPSKHKSFDRGVKRQDEGILKSKINNILEHFQKAGDLIHLTITNGLWNDVINNNYYKLGQAGLPDVVLFLKNGKTVFLEIKHDTPYLSKIQKEVRKKLLLFGHSYFVVKSKEDIYNILSKYNIKIIN